MHQEYVVKVKREKVKDWSSCDLLCSYIKDRVMKTNRNFMCCVTGATGTGKSYSCIGLGEKLMGQFKIDHVVFSQVEFMALINSGKLNRGDVILFDEVSVSQNARDWYSQTNKLLNNVLCTFRHLNLIVFFTVPYSEFVDKQARMLFHAIFEAVKIDFNKGLNFIKPEFMQYNQGTQKIYRKFLKIQVANGSRHKLGLVAVPKADPVLLSAYEVKRREFTTKLNNIKAEDKPVKAEGFIRKREQIKECLEKGVALVDIAKNLDVDLSYVYRIKQVYS